MNPTAIDLFAGAGGTTLGLKRAGFDVRVAVDYDPHKARTLQINHRHSIILGANGTSGDVRKMKGRDLLSIAQLRKKSLDLLVGCPPCQGFSLQGKRDPTDQRNALYLEFVRLIDEIEPRMIAFENVPGIVSFQSGETLNDLKEQIKDLDYSILTWTLNAQDLGIPQARKRIFLIGSKEGLLPTPPMAGKEKVGVWEAIADLPNRISDGTRCHSVPITYRSDSRSAYARSLRGHRTKVANCEISNHALSLLKRMRSLGWNERDEFTWHRRLHPREPAPTLTAGSRTRTACRPIHPFADRVLTVREGARLASFPDWYAFPAHKAEAWSQIGNCVPPLMAERVFKRVRLCL